MKSTSGTSGDPSLEPAFFLVGAAVAGRGPALTTLTVGALTTTLGATLAEPKGKGGALTTVMGPNFDARRSCAERSGEFTPA